MEINTLESTVQLMLSSDYKDRFKAEYYQLKIRLDKLASLLDKYDKGELEFTPTCPISVLKLQFTEMGFLLTLLEERAKMEDIDLCL